MQQLKNGCSISEISVFPKNWNTKSASLNVKWYIYYRFYQNGNSKLIAIRDNINKINNLQERQNYIKFLVSQEYDNLINNNYNPINKIIGSEENFSNINQDTPIIKALYFAYNHLTVVDAVKNDMKSVLKYIGEGVDYLKFSDLHIGEVRRRHIKLLLEHLSDKRKWSNNQYNHYRTSLMMLFKELMEYDIVESNYPRELSKKKLISKSRVVLNIEQRQIVKKYWIENDYRFYLYMQIFFHSGCRTTEFRRLKLKDIDLLRQQYKITILKGKTPKEVVKPIKDIALKYWIEYLREFNNEEDYFLSKRFSPGKTALSYSHVTRHWNRHIKAKLNIDVDFYAFKHLNSDEVAERLSLRHAAILDSHDNTSTTKIYAINQNKREMEELKKIGNEL